MDSGCILKIEPPDCIWDVREREASRMTPKFRARATRKMEFCIMPSQRRELGVDLELVFLSQVQNKPSRASVVVASES